MNLKLYKKYSPLMESCDLVEWQSYGSPIGWMIRKITKRPVNHTSIILRPKEYGAFKDRRFLLEALGGGPVPRLLSYRLKVYEGRVRWLPLNKNYVTPLQREIMIAWAIEECVKGKRYDYGSLVKNIAGKVSVNADQWFCSEYATAMFIKGRLLSEDTKAYRPGEFDGLDFIGKPVIIYDSIINEKVAKIKEERSKK